MTKSRIAIELSKIRGYVNPKIKLEQYVTDSEFAAEILWNAYLDGNIENKSIADLGCGTGIFSFGCLILNAKKVYAVDNDIDSLNIAKENIKDARCEFIHSDVNEFKVSKVFKVKLPLKKSYDFHRKNVEKIEVGCWFFEKQ